MLVLVLGDLHIPQRSSAIPAKFLKLLVAKQGSFNSVLCTGNLVTKEQLDFLRTLSADVHVVKGDFDEVAGVPDEKVVQIEGFKFGLLHGHQVVPWGDHDALAMHQRRLDVDVLVSGHTHRFESFEQDGKLFINPGSITGAFAPNSVDVKPEFVLMDVQGGKLTCFVYRLIGGPQSDEYKVYQISHKKNGGGADTASEA